MRSQVRRFLNQQLALSRPLHSIGRVICMGMAARNDLRIQKIDVGPRI